MGEKFSVKIMKLFAVKYSVRTRLYAHILTSFTTAILAPSYDEAAKIAISLYGGIDGFVLGSIEDVTI